MNFPTRVCRLQTRRHNKRPPQLGNELHPILVRAEIKSLLILIATGYDTTIVSVSSNWLERRVCNCQS